MQTSGMHSAGCRWQRLRPTLSWIRGSHGAPGSGSPCAKARMSRPGILPPNAPVTRSTSLAAFSSSSPGVAGDSSTPSICILGGGFGGLYTAIRLESLMWPRNQKPRITLVDQNDQFVFKPLLYDLLNKTASEDEVAPEYSALLAPYNIRFIKSKVQAVTPTPVDDETVGPGSGGVVTLADGLKLPYDWLVLSLGSDTNLEMVPGAAEHAVGFSTIADVQRVDAALAHITAATADPNAPRPVISVVGAGYSGVELAATVAQRMAGASAVHLLSPSGEAMPGQAPPLVEAAEKSLLEAGVVTRAAKVEKVFEGRDEPACADVGKKLALEIRGKRESEHSDLVLWTAGTKAATAQQPEGFPFPANERGMTTTDATLRVPGHPHVFAIGDTAAALATAPDAPQGGFAPTAQVAMQQADYVAWNLWAAINGRTLLPFKYQHLGTMLTFGPTSGAVKLNLPLPEQLAEAFSGSPLGSVASALGVKVDGGSNGVTVGGPLAAAVRRAAYWYRQPTNDQKLRVGASWVTAGLQEIQRAVPSAPPSAPALVAAATADAAPAAAAVAVATPPGDADASGDSAAGETAAAPEAADEAPPDAEAKGDAADTSEGAAGDGKASSTPGPTASGEA